MKKSSTKKKSTPRKKNTTVESSEALLKPGQKAPSFSLMNDQGEKVSLKDFSGKKLIVYFYPKDNTPGCTQESCDFRDQFSRLKKAGVEVVGVSKDSVASHLKFKTKFDFPFSLLSDSEGEMCESYGVWKEKSLYGKKYMGIERTTFLIDEKGKIMKVYPKVSVKGHVDAILKDLV